MKKEKKHNPPGPNYKKSKYGEGGVLDEQNIV